MHLALQPPLLRLAELGLGPRWILLDRRENQRADHLASLSVQQAARAAPEGHTRNSWWIARRAEG
eukprot:4760183-Alexandrium_andersonii.AAC.1